MKFFKITPIVAILFVLVSCEPQVPDFHTFTVSLFVAFDEEVPAIYRAGAEVELTNLTKNYTFIAETDDSSYVTFEGLEPGFYRSRVIHSFSENGIAFHVNGFQFVDVFSDMEDTIEMVTSKTNAFVIKQYYYSACLTPAGNQYSADQFIEIHNNSDLIQYADGMSILEHESYAIEESYFSYIDDTIVCRMIWTIPGDGNDYPLNPGESIVIARDGINHQDDSLGNPLCPVDLSMADFEFWVESVTGDDMDAPYAVNLIENLFTYRGSDVVFHTRGGSAIAIALIPGTYEEKQAFINSHLIAKADVPSRFYGKIPVEWVLDAVEATWDEEHAIYKRLPLELDAGYTYVAAGSRSGLCLRRKVQEVIDGRYIYTDTNNSTEDFLTDVVPTPWVNE